MIDIRDYIEPAIAKSGMKKNAIADRAGLSAQQLSDIIAKRRRLDANEFVNICKSMNITPNDVLTLIVSPDLKQL